MYRILIVDDEEIITNSLVHLVASSIENVDVYAAYSGKEALSYLERAGFDVLVTDIQMPGMSGVELLKQTHTLYPNCRAIFLSGHDEFTYAYQALQYRAVRYILKNEKDEVLLQTIRNCLSDIEQEAQKAEMLQNARAQMERCLPALRREYMESLINEALPSRGEIDRFFSRYHISLSCDTPVILLCCRVDDPCDADAPTAVDMVVRDSLGCSVRCECCVAKSSFLLWMMQSADAEHQEQAVAIVRGAAERLQRAVNQSLGLSVSFLLDTTPTEWSELRRRADEMHRVMGFMLDKREKQAFLYLDYFEHGRNGAINEVAPHRDTQALRREWTQLLQAHSSEALGRFVQKLIAELKQTGEEDGLWQLTLFHELNAALLEYITQGNLLDEMAGEQLFLTFMNQPMAGEAFERADRLIQLARTAFSLWESRKRSSDVSLVQTVDAFIREHIDGDLSLVTLSEHVYLNPSYLSRRYKELSGNNLSDVIAQRRMALAMELLANERLKVHEIAARVGYLSPTHFIRIFKKATGLTPQDWRAATMRGQTAKR